MKSIEATGKTLDDAIKEGLKQLGVTIDDVDVEILSSGGWLRKAKVRLTISEETSPEITPVAEPTVTERVATKPVKAQPEEKKPENVEVKKETKPEEIKAKSVDKKPIEKNGDKPQKPNGDKPYKKENRKPLDKPRYEFHEAETVKADDGPVKEIGEQQVELARAYVMALLEKMGVVANLVINTDKGSIDIDIVSDDATVIGHHGEVLDSIQQLTKRAVEEGDDKHVAVNIDCKGYRGHREKTLIAMANKMAAKAIKTGRKVVLEPMNNTQRKIIHATLNENDKVFTKSEGKEPNRRVVIIPKRSRRRYDDKKPVANENANVATETTEFVAPVSAPESSEVKTEE